MSELSDLVARQRVIVNELEKRACEKSLAQFVKCAWHIIEPGTPLLWNWHINTVCGYLEAFHKHQLPDRRLIINIPPGTLKSILVSVMYPAWVWCTEPENRFLSFANEQGLSIRDALRMKQIVTSEWYQEKWPISMQADQNEKTLFANDARGFRQSQGITASNTGKRGDCFPGYIEVATDKGLRRIDSIQVGDIVYSINIESMAIELKPVNAVYVNGPNTIVEVILSNGEVIHCTPNHKFWTTEDGYVEAVRLICTTSDDTAHTVITKSKERIKVISVSRFGYEHKTYCLNIADNHNMFVGKSEGVLASNCVIMDDLIDAKHAFSDVIRQSINDTFDQTITSRINDPIKSGFILIMQRLHESDIAGHLLKKSKTKWTHLSIPMRYEGSPSFDAGRDIGRPELNDPRTKKGQLLFPQRFTEQSVQALAEDLGEYGFAGQMQQRPVPAGGGIIKKHWWRIWPDDVAIPTCTHIFHSWDTAFSEKDSKTSAFSAMTRWGIFFHEARDRYCIMALGMWFDRVGFDELRKKVKESDKKYNPDINLVEKKATGITLVQELKRASPGKVRAYTPGRGEDKISRGHSVSPIFESGQVYAPNRMWALGDGHEKLGLIDYVAQFPNGAAPCPDLFDTVTQALIYMRSGNWSGSHDDDKDEPYEDKPRTDEDIEDNDQPKRSYYG